MDRLGSFAPRHLQTQEWAISGLWSNSSKGDKGVYEWYGIERRNEIPRIVEGKYLKLLYTLHENQGTLQMGRQNLVDLCKICSQGRLCKESKLTVYCLESVLLKPQAASGSTS